MRQWVIVAAAMLVALPSASALTIGWNGPDPTRVLDAWSWVKLETPIFDSEASGNVLLEGTSGAQRGYLVRDIGIFVDSRYVGSAIGTDEWKFPLETDRLVDGKHTLGIYAFAQLDAVPNLLQAGHGAYGSFVSANGLVGELLYEGTFDGKGLSADVWTHTLEQRYTGLRVSVETQTTNAAAPILGQAVVTYVDALDEEEPGKGPKQVWIAAFGPAGAFGSMSRPPHDVLEPGGVLALGGISAGEGRVTVRVEALPLATDA